MSNRSFLFLVIFLSSYQYLSCAIQHNDYLTVSERVKNYLVATNSTYWLQNSNKIGVGYNPLYGSPVCYSGSCQMEGFRRSIFKLNYLQPVRGSCTDKLVPEHVELDCLPSTTWDATTEKISTLEELHKSISNIVGSSFGGDIQSALFSYRTSVETRYMIDSIIQRNRTTMKTKADISYVKLSMFEPQMELSDDFRYVITNLPCCDYNSDVQQYIFEYIFNYFGFTYLSEILLGGIAQQTLSITRESYQTMISQGYNIENEAKVDFYISTGATQQYGYNEQTHNQFISQVQEKHSTTLGGDTSLTTIEQWSKTVPSNPVIIKFSIRNMFGLLTRTRFPNDSSIQDKASLIARALNDYIVNPIYCYNNCSGHGDCVSSSYFQFGICNCYQDYMGFDCSIYQPKISPTTAKPHASSGVACAFYNIRLTFLQLCISNYILFFFWFTC